MKQVFDKNGNLKVTGAGGGGGGNLALSAGTNQFSTGTIEFSNSNGVTFGMDAAKVITASVQTNYQSAGAYLTTAMLSNAGSNFVGLNSAITANGVSMTNNSSGLSLNFPAFLTTAQPVGAYLTTAMLSNADTGFLSTSQSSLFQQTSLMSNYQSTGNYLTTAMLSNANTSFVGLNSALTANGVSATINSSGISLNIPAFLTTAQSPGAYLTTAALSQDSSKYAGTNAAMTGGSITVNTSGISISLPVYLTTAQSPGAYLTTAMQSNAVTISNIKLSAGTLSALRSDISFNNSNGVSFGLETNGAITATVATNYQSTGNYLTTAALSNHSHAFATTTTNGTVINVATSNSNGITIAVPPYITTGLTTAAQSNQVVNSLNGSTGQISLNVGSSLSSSTNGSSITFGLASNITTALQSAGAYLTTAMQSNAVTLSNIRISGGTTSNLLSAITFADSNGVSFGLNAGTITATVATNYQSQGAYLTTAALSQNTSNYAGLSTGFNGANLSGSITLNTAGINISLSANAPAAGVGIAAGTRTATTAGNILFDTGNGITFGLNGVGGSVMTASHNGLTTARASNDGIGLNTAQSNVTWTVNSSGLSLDARGYAGTGTSESGAAAFTLNSNGLAFNAESLAGIGTSATNASVTLNSNGLAISVAAPAGGVTYSGYDKFGNGAEILFGQQGNGTVFIQPMNAPAFQYNAIAMPLLFTGTSNQSGSFTVSFQFGIYTRNASTLSLLASTSGSTNITMSGTVGSYSLFSGIRNYTIPWTSTMSASNYWIGIQSRTTTGGAAGMTLSQQVVSNMASNLAGDFGGANNATKQFALGQGFYTATSAALPASIAFTQINGTGSNNLRVPVFSFISGLI